MQAKRFFMGLAVMIICAAQANAQYAKTDSTYKRWLIGSSLFVLLGNFDTENPPHFGQLNVGYRITGKDVVSLELRTWRYAWPNGIHPFLNEAYKKPEEKFPGYVREYGFAIGYQRFFVKGLYAEVNSMPTWQSFINENGEKIDNGFQIFNTYRVGYHIKLFKDRLFIQPSMAMTHRAYHTTLPDGFKQLDDKWSKFIFPEPGLHFGINL